MQTLDLNHKPTPLPKSYPPLPAVQVPRIPRLLGYCHVDHAVRVREDGEVDVKVKPHDVFLEGTVVADVLPQLAQTVGNSPRLYATSLQKGLGLGRGGVFILGCEAAPRMVAALPDRVRDQHMVC